MSRDSHHALLVHSMSGGVHVSVHDIDFRGETPMLGAGRVLSRTDLDALVGVLSGVKHEIRILPACALYASADLVVLHLPGAKREIALREGSVEMRVPDLVAAITRAGMHLAAVEPGRPSSASVLYRAPLPNMTDIDRMCAGNTGFAPRPDMDIEHLAEAVEAFLFQTLYTHSLRVDIADEALRSLRLKRGTSDVAHFERVAALSLRGKAPSTGWLKPMDITLSEWLANIMEGA